MMHNCQLNGFNKFSIPVALLIGLAAAACGSSKGGGNSRTGTAPNRPFSVAMLQFSVQGTSASYILSTTLAGTPEGSALRAEDTSYFCSLNGSAFEPCRVSGQLPSSRLQIGINTFQVQAKVLGREATDPLYHEFTLGLDGR